MRTKSFLIGLFILFLFLENGCRTISVVYKPNEWQQGFSMHIPTCKTIGYINGETDWVYIFRYDDFKDGKLIFISYSYSTLSVYHLLSLYEKIEEAYGDSVFVINENGYKCLKDLARKLEFTYDYYDGNGNVATAIGQGNPMDIFFKKMFFEQLGLHNETFNFDPSSIKLLYRPDTLVYEGTDSNNHAWKSIDVVGKIIVGYLNVPLKEKQKFDKYLYTIKEIDTVSLETDDIVRGFLNDH